MATLLEKFTKYTPSEGHRKILETVSAYSLRTNRELRLMEVDITLPSPVKKAVLYAIEADIAAAYQLNSVRLLPKYPRESFTLSYMHEIVEEAYRVGKITHGFLESYSLNEEEGDIVISIGFSQEGTELLHKAETDRVMEQILFSEFGIVKRVKIVGTGDLEERYESFAAERRRELDRIQATNTAVMEKRREEEARAKAAAEAEKPTLVTSLYGEEKIADALLYAKDLKDRYSVLWMWFDLFANK